MSTTSNSNDSGGALAPRYFVRIIGVGPWMEVTKEKYIDLERSAGFSPHVPPGEACGAFSNGCISGCTWFPQVWSGIGTQYVPATNVIEIGSDWHHILGAPGTVAPKHTPKKGSL